jgi:hypothetical protein
MSEQLTTTSERLAESIAWLGSRAEKNPDCGECEAMFALAEAATVLLSSESEEENLDVLLTNICDALDDDDDTHGRWQKP